MNTHRWFAVFSSAAVFIAINTVSAAEISRTPFQFYFEKGCGGDHVCAFDFPKVKTNTRQEARNVSCFLLKTASVPIERVQLIVQNAQFDAVSRSNLSMQLVNSYDVGVPFGSWAANHNVFVFASAKQHFQIFAVSGNVAASFNMLGCHISGDLVEFEPVP